MDIETRLRARRLLQVADIFSIWDCLACLILSNEWNAVKDSLQWGLKKWYVWGRSYFLKNSRTVRLKKIKNKNSVMENIPERVQRMNLTSYSGFLTNRNVISTSHYMAWLQLHSEGTGFRRNLHQLLSLKQSLSPASQHCNIADIVSWMFPLRALGLAHI